MTTSESTEAGPETIRKHPDAKCEDCGLNSRRNAFVPTKFPNGDASIALVGEAPGFNEGQTGEPFTGSSGRLLNLVLAQHGIDRESVLLTNACLCRPKDNRTPTASEVACCWPRLKKELEGAKPEVIVPLGNTAAQAILSSKVGIGKLRIGKPKVSPHFNAKIIPTFHPAACLRTSDFFPYLVNDLGKIDESKQTPWVEPNWTLADSLHEAIEALERLKDEITDKLVVDIEVGIDRDTHFGHAERYEWLCIGLSWREDEALVLGENALRYQLVRERLGQLLSTVSCIGHNFKFDRAGLGFGNFTFDTMLASYALDERPGTNGLDYNAVELLGAPPWKHVIHQYIDKNETYANVPRDILYKYCAFDACAEYQLYKRFKRELVEKNVQMVHDRLVYYTPLITHMETAGLGWDIDYHRELMTRYLEIINDLDEQLRPWVANPRSPKQVTETLQNHFGIHRVESTDAAHLNDWLEGATIKGNEELAEFLRLMLVQRKEAKLYGTYIKGLGRHIYEGRIHGSFSLHGTVTGRLAGKRPSLLNIPRGSLIKSQFIPDRPGDVFVQCDIRAAELRVIAVEARDEYLREVLSDEGRDIHSEVATRFFGDGFTKEQRVRAKAVVYGLGYGREAYSIAAEYGIPVKEAEQYLKTFFSVIPATVAWKERIKDTIFNKQEDLITHFGRHRRFWLITRDNMKDVEKEGYAYIPQSTANDINLTAAARLHGEYGVDVRLTVHDSILAQIDADSAEGLASLMQRVVLETAADIYSDYVPFTTDVAIGPNWGAV